MQGTLWFDDEAAHEGSGGLRHSRLYPDQSELVAAIEEEMGRGRAVMATAATGSGKTVCAAEVISRRPRALFLAPTRIVAEQTAQRLRHDGIDAVFATGEDVPAWWPVEPLVVCTTYASAVRRGGRLLGGLPLVVADEGHHAADSIGKPKGLTAFVGEAKRMSCEVLGLTATCWRMSKKEGYERTWDALVQGKSLPQLEREGRLSPLVLERLAEHVLTGDAASASGDYNLAQIERLNADNALFTTAAVDWALQRARKPDGSMLERGLAYAVGQIHAGNIANYAAAQSELRVGLMTSGLDGLRDGDRRLAVKRRDGWEVLDLDDRIELGDEACLDGLHSGRLNFVCNVAKAVEGLDVPALDYVLNVRPTRSLALYRQMTGRAARKSPGKEHGLILDATDNASRLGHPMQHEEWSLLPRGDAEKEGRAVRRACTDADDVQCGQLIYAAQQQCPVCGAEQGEACGTCGKYSLWKNLAARSGDAPAECSKCLRGRRPPGHPILDVEEGECPSCGSPMMLGRHGWYCWHGWSKSKGIKAGRNAFCGCACECWKKYERRAKKSGAGDCCGCEVKGRLCGCNGGRYEVLVNDGEERRPWKWVLPYDIRSCAQTRAA